MILVETNLVSDRRRRTSASRGGFSALTWAWKMASSSIRASVGQLSLPFRACDRGQMATIADSSARTIRTRKMLVVKPANRSENDETSLLVQVDDNRLDVRNLLAARLVCRNSRYPLAGKKSLLQGTFWRPVQARRSGMGHYGCCVLLPTPRDCEAGHFTWVDLPLR